MFVVLPLQYPRHTAPLWPTLLGRGSSNRPSFLHRPSDLVRGVPDGDIPIPVGQGLPGDEGPCNARIADARRSGIQSTRPESSTTSPRARPPVAHSARRSSPVFQTAAEAPIGDGRGDVRVGHQPLFRRQNAPSPLWPTAISWETGLSGRRDRRPVRESWWMLIGHRAVSRAA